ncbi:MAG: hypothetical protein JJLCMIEE_03427 [Acidimicrobiales bacterium]|nr:MAG: thiolase family protein [Actinomycetota bacterium]MBV6510288.1 hypothetical protein [Acidimicrobiales bacterium]RIK03372.1 MAG: thiolase [Acidobacteriota bacterium]
MSADLSDLRPVHVVGIGLHPYRRGSETPYVDLGLTAVREALADAGMAWADVESSFVGNVNLGFASGRVMLRHLGATGIPMAQVENASASGSTAFAQACLDVASGIREVSLALGVDKPALPDLAPTKTGIRDLTASRLLPVAHFALLADEYMHRYGHRAEDLAAVAVKNHHNGALNPNAQRRRTRTLDEVMGEAPLAGVLTRLQCCPIGEGAAAAIVASDDAIDRLALDPARAVRVLASVTRTERVYAAGHDHDAALTAETGALAFGQAGISPQEIDVLEVHDAFSIEELLYIEALGLCDPGTAPLRLSQGAWEIGGECAVSPSGGLLAMGHPIGPTGVGQIVEITRQLRGEAAPRQHPGSRIGLAHMVGVGAVCVIHILAAR